MFSIAKDFFKGMETTQIKPSTHRTIAACYFTFLSIIATFIIQAMLFLFGMGDLIPFFMSFLLSIPIAWLSGMIFGNAIITSPKKSKWRCFLWGFSLILFALPLYDLCLLFLLHNIHPYMYNLGHGLKDSLILYLFIIIYSFVLIGSWLCLLSGFSAIFLRDHFAPNVLKLSTSNSPKK